MRLRGGTQELHQQQWVAHHTLNRLDQEGAQVNVIGAPPVEDKGREHTKRSHGSLGSYTLQQPTGSHPTSMAPQGITSTF